MRFASEMERKAVSQTGQLTKKRSAAFLRSQIAARYSNVQFLHITRDSAHSILEYTQNPTCSETELIRTLAKYATVELSRNPEQLLVRNPHILKHIFHMSSQFAVTYFHLELDVTNCDFHQKTKRSQKKHNLSAVPL